MPVTKTAKKALRSSKRKAISNRPVKTKAQSAVKELRSNPSQENLKKAFSALDKASKKGIFHKGKVSRLKSRLAKLLAKSEDKPKDKKPKTKSAKKKTTSKKTLK